MSHTTFAAMGCRENILTALEGRGFTTPTPVQAACFEPGMEGRDLLVQSRTGSGKTLAFGLPLMHRLKEGRHPQALILAPTRELAQQVAGELQSIQPALAVALLVGGLSYPPQLRALHYGAQVIVGTPGRVMDHLDRQSLNLSQVSMVVLDECDEMLNMGFLEDVEKILSHAPTSRQTYLFSATLPAPIASLAKRFLQDPVHIELAGGGGATQHADIAHTPCLVSEPFHDKALVNFLLLDEPASALIFTKRKQEAEDVAESLREAGLSAEHLHGDLAQHTRNRILASFKSGALRYLVATDVAARGIDVEGMPLVIHLGIPTQLENYIHRSGRTGRAGQKGCSLALVNFKESRILLAWARRANLKLDWRAVPTQAEIKTARTQRLGAKLEKLEAPQHLPLAEQLLTDRSPKQLVAALLSLVSGDHHNGFDIPEPPKRDKSMRADKDFKAKGDKPFAPRKPFSDTKPKGDREESGKPRSYKKWEGEEKKPFSKPGKPWEKKDQPAPREGEKRPYKRPEKTAGKPAFKGGKPTQGDAHSPFKGFAKKTDKKKKTF